MGGALGRLSLCDSISWQRDPLSALKPFLQLHLIFLGSRLLTPRTQGPPPVCRDFPLRCEQGEERTCTSQLPACTLSGCTLQKPLPIPAHTSVTSGLMARIGGVPGVTGMDHHP